MRARLRAANKRGFTQWRWQFERGLCEDQRHALLPSDTYGAPSNASVFCSVADEWQCVARELTALIE
jgi:hypothetical protein